MKQLVTSLEGATVGSRVLLAIAPKDGVAESIGAKGVKKSDTLLFVIDVKSARTPLAKADRRRGRSRRRPADGHARRRRQAHDHDPDGVAAPTTLVSQVLIKGTGPVDHRRPDRQRPLHRRDLGHRQAARLVVGPRRAARRRVRHRQRASPAGTRASSARPSVRRCCSSSRPTRATGPPGAATAPSRAPTPSSSSSTSSTPTDPATANGVPASKAANNRATLTPVRHGIGPERRQWDRARRGDELRPPRSREPVAEGEARRDPPDRRRPAPPVPDLGGRGRPPGPVAAGRRSRWRWSPRATAGSRSCSTPSSGSSPARPTSSCSACEIGWLELEDA